MSSDHQHQLGYLWHVPTTRSVKEAKQYFTRSKKNASFVSVYF